MYFAFAGDISYVLPHTVPLFVRDVAKGMASRTFAGDNSYVPLRTVPILVRDVANEMATCTLVDDNSYVQLRTVPILVRDVGDGGRESLHRSASQDDGGSLLRMTGAVITR